MPFAVIKYRLKSSEKKNKNLSTNKAVHVLGVISLYVCPCLHTRGINLCLFRVCVRRQDKETIAYRKIKLPRIDTAQTQLSQASGAVACPVDTQTQRSRVRQNAPASEAIDRANIKESPSSGPLCRPVSQSRPS